MQIARDKITEMLAYEAFIRRAAEVGLPFMLKGSYVTRQYFPEHVKRLPADLDWVYMHRIANQDDAEKIFSDWMIEVTEYKMFDGADFGTFRQNPFWRMIDYAMDDDFPTVNTNLYCSIDGGELNSHFLDISFNLEIEAEPVPLLYKPLRGEPFTVPYSVPLCLQAAWKLHQTLVRPRFKDIFDLTWLLQHSGFNSSTLQQALQALANECSADNVDINRLRHVLSGDLEALFPQNYILSAWDMWRHNYRGKFYINLDYNNAETITDVTQLPLNLSVFIENFLDALDKAGLNSKTLENLPVATWERKKVYDILYTRDDVNDKKLPGVPEKPKLTRLQKIFSKLFG
jgi:hypothetical protein